MYIKPQNILFEYIIDSFFQTLHYQICKLQVKKFHSLAYTDNRVLTSW